MRQSPTVAAKRADRRARPSFRCSVLRRRAVKQKPRTQCEHYPEEARLFVEIDQQRRNSGACRCQAHPGDYVYPKERGYLILCDLTALNGRCR